MTSRRRRPDGALDHHDQSSLEFGHQGPSILGLGKEALLTRLTTRRSQEHHEVIDYIFQHAEQREAYVFTTTYVLAEVIGTIRSGTDSHTVGEIWDSVQASNITVLEDGRQWKADSSGADGEAIARRPFDQFDYVLEFYEENPTIEFKFHEATVVSNAILLEELSPGKKHTVYIATFDGDLAALADTSGIDVLPYSTDLRDDSRRSG